VKLVHLDDGDIVCDVARVVIEDDEGGEESVDETVSVSPDEEEV
jgi:hypothetical protein